MGPTTDKRSGSTKNRHLLPLLVLGFLLLGGVVFGAFFLIPSPEAQEPTPVPVEASAPGVKRVTIPVSGMSCSACVARLKKTLEGIEGVTEVKVSLEHRNAEVGFVDAKVTPERLAAAINDAGYTAGAPVGGK